jgi:quinolinate synthase
LLKTRLVLARRIGDSLAPVQAAKKGERDIIAFGGVHFMAERAVLPSTRSTEVTS